MIKPLYTYSPSKNNNYKKIIIVSWPTVNTNKFESINGENNFYNYNSILIYLTVIQSLQEYMNETLHPISQKAQ